MTGQEALDKVEKYKYAEGKFYRFNGKTIEISKVIVGPTNLSEWSANYRAYHTYNEKTVLLGRSGSYDIYFLPRGAGTPIKTW
jgi:hypothetical protein